jgi:hypothetical protein
VGPITNLEDKIINVCGHLLEGSIFDKRVLHNEVVQSQYSGPDVLKM